MRKVVICVLGLYGILGYSTIGACEPATMQAVGGGNYYEINERNVCTWVDYCEVS